MYIYFLYLVIHMYFFVYLFFIALVNPRYRAGRWSCDYHKMYCLTNVVKVFWGQKEHCEKNSLLICRIIIFCGKRIKVGSDFLPLVFFSSGYCSKMNVWVHFCSFTMIDPELKNITIIRFLRFIELYF